MGSSLAVRGAPCWQLWFGKRCSVSPGPSCQFDTAATRRQVDPGYDVDRHGQLNAADWIERALRAAIAVPAGSVSRLRKSDQRWVRNVSLPDWAAWLPQLTGPSAIDNAAHARRDRIVMGHVRRRHFRPAEHHP